MATRIFHWDEVNDCLSHETDENGNVLVDYTYEPKPYGPLISERRDGVTYTHHYDALGSTTMLTDDNGDVTDTFLHDAWGNLLTSSGSSENPFRWNGQPGYDDGRDTGLYYVRARIQDKGVLQWAKLPCYAV